MKVGFIGLGIMGRPMAGHLIEGGHRSSSTDRGTLPAGADRGGRHGLRLAAGRWRSAADVIITMVPDTPARGSGAVRRQTASPKV